MKKYFASFIIFIPLLFSCSKKSAPEAQKNLFGGLSRAHNYEYVGDFFARLIQPVVYNEPSGAIKTPLALNDEQMVVALNDSTVALCESNTVKWKFKLGDYMLAGNLCADANLNIYALDANGELFSISKDGKLNWRIQALTKKEQWTLYCEPLVNSEGIVCACSAGELVLVGFDGKIKWTKDYSASPIDRFSGDKDGNIYLPISNNEFGKTDTLIALDKGGNAKWRIALPNSRAYIAPALHDKTIYLAGFIDKGDHRTSLIYSINKENGQINWQKEMPQKIRSVSVDENGVIYLSLGDIGLNASISQLMALKDNSQELWSNYLQNSIISPLYISSKKLAFIGAKGDAYGLYLFSKEKGDFYTVLTLTDYLPFISNFEVLTDGTLILATCNKLSILRINEPAVYKLLP